MSSILVWVIVYPASGFYSYPRSVVVLDSIVLIMLMGGIRVGTRLFRERNRLHFFDFDKKLVFIYGAGDAGELLLRDMHKNSRYNYQPVGFIDDDERKKGLKIHSVPVLGAGKDLEKLIKKFVPLEIIVAIPSGKPWQGGEIYQKISMAISTTNGKDTEEFFNQLIDLQVCALSGDKDQIMEKIRGLVPAYNPTVVESCQNGDIPGIILPKAIDSMNLSDYPASS